MAIFSFADQETEKIWAGKRSAKLPGNHLEALRGDRKGQYSIRINNQWRICFIWKGKESSDVQIVDYH
ncbi:MAG: type II toxin-antitoxin system RelE/ParE family toxin [Alphaproteobacteria bacterium]|jgi:proteic killer suppression protein|nr:type II toxin-antitoxin system RelE/ParE family toxin [Thalassospira sp.]MCE2964596.1 type II toxin-antitoxin system RelE/ParE family toxin [Alphaproteobacteria bacterium]